MIQTKCLCFALQMQSITICSSFFLIYYLTKHRCLNFSVQTQLVRAITTLKNTNTRPFRLALILYLFLLFFYYFYFPFLFDENSCGDAQQHLLSEFGAYIRTPNLISDDDMKSMLLRNTDKIYVVTSDLPGAGKSEEIKRLAFENRRV